MSVLVRLAIPACLALAAPNVLAERPMRVDDASTLPQGGTKLELGWHKDARLRGAEAAWGFAPLDGLELELGLGRFRDHDADPVVASRAVAVQAKWVPLQAEYGLSAGFKAALGHDRVDRGTHANAASVDVLATWTFGSGVLAHANIGREWVRGTQARDSATTWGVGMDCPVTATLHVTLETFGARHASPDRAVGLRVAIAESVKLSAALGNGNDRRFANAGVSWEF